MYLPNSTSHYFPFSITQPCFSIWTSMFWKLYTLLLAFWQHYWSYIFLVVVSTVKFVDSTGIIFIVWDKCVNSSSLSLYYRNSQRLDRKHLAKCLAGSHDRNVQRLCSYWKCHSLDDSCLRRCALNKHGQTYIVINDHIPPNFYYWANIEFSQQCG